MTDREASAAPGGARTFEASAPETTDASASDFRQAFASDARRVVCNIEHLRTMQGLGPCLHFNPEDGEPALPTAFEVSEVSGSPNLEALTDSDPTDLTVNELLAAVRGGILSIADVVKAFYRRIGRLNEAVNAFVWVIPRTEVVQVESGPLQGVPFAAKDVIETADIRTTAGSKQLLDYVPSEDADVIQRLRSSGAILLGKLNTHEFAAGATGENPHFGVVHNPWDLGRIAGGSSSGSAAAVSARLVPVALGSDTAGSVRIPASLCGVVGLKPTFGLVSCRGVIPEAWSLDHVGLITRSVADLPLLLAAVTGGANRPLALRMPATPMRWRIGVPEGWVTEEVAQPVRTAFKTGLALLADFGAEIHEVQFPNAEELTAITRVIMFAEAAAWHYPYLQNSPELYGQDVRVRFEFGAELSAVEYINANRLRSRLCSDLRRTWSDVDFLVTPTTPITAPVIGAATGIAASLSRFTAAANLLGWPALTMPIGFDEAGLPIGFQIMAAPYRDANLLQIAADLETATNFAHRRPPLVADSCTE